MLFFINFPLTTHSFKKIPARFWKLEVSFRCPLSWGCLVTGEASDLLRALQAAQTFICSVTCSFVWQIHKLQQQAEPIHESLRKQSVRHIPILLQPVHSRTETLTILLASSHAIPSETLFDRCHNTGTSSTPMGCWSTLNTSAAELLCPLWKHSLRSRQPLYRV